MQLNCSYPMNLPQDKPRAKAWCSSCAVVPLEEAGCWTCAKGKGGKKGRVCALLPKHNVTYVSSRAEPKVMELHCCLLQEPPGEQGPPGAVLGPEAQSPKLLCGH